MRRRCLGIRCRTGIGLFLVATMMFGIYFTFKSLRAEDKDHRHRISASLLDKRKGLHFRASKDKHDGIPKQQEYGDQNWVKGQPHQPQAFSSLAIKYNPTLQKQVKSFIEELYPSDWGLARDTDEIALELKSLLLDIGLESNMSCKDIDSLQLSGTMAHSNNKYIERGRYEDYSQNEVTIKSQSFDISTKIECMKKIYDVEHCTPMGNYRLMREILFLAVLRHPTIVNMLGYCVRGNQISPEIRKKGLIVITELGSVLRPGSLSVMAWPAKVMLAVQLANLLDYLDASPLGSMGLEKLGMEDFILVNSGYSLRLVDLDGMMTNEKQCRWDSDCGIEDKTLDIKCEDGVCQGRNKVVNMYQMGKVMFDPILRSAPASQAQKTDDLINKILNNDITTKELIADLKDIQKEAGDPPAPVIHNFHPEVREQPRRIIQPQDDPELNRPGRNNPLLFDKQEEETAKREGVGEYTRYDQANYQGMYDFHCDNSRVVWGCVLTARSIQDSQDMCNAIPKCQAFVIYSSQPEADTLMTIILKNSSQTNPQQSAGTTLFIRKEGAGRAQSLADEDDDQGDKNNIRNTDSEEESKPMSRDQCLRTTRNNHEDAYRSRERRLMTHLGLKGFQESDWLHAVESQDIASISTVTPADGDNARGGKVVVKFAPSSDEQPISKALFMAEMGPEQYHSAYVIVYTLDRLLGLYHTPPSLVRQLPNSVIQKFSDDTEFRKVFVPLADRVGTVKGIFTVPIPRVMKPDKLTLQPLASMVTKVSKFTRPMKMQFEYVFLWWLTNIAKGTNKMHTGYKGHMIHFDADKAFQDPLLRLTGYFFHCQFPSVVYKTLNCFRCHTPPGQPQSTSVCSLGQEVVKRTKLAGLKRKELHNENDTDNEFILDVNDAATSALEIIDKCIRKHGREAVLY